MIRNDRDTPVFPFFVTPFDWKPNLTWFMSVDILSMSNDTFVQIKQKSGLDEAFTDRLGCTPNEARSPRRPKGVLAAKAAGEQVKDDTSVKRRVIIFPRIGREGRWVTLLKRIRISRLLFGGSDPGE